MLDLKFVLMVIIVFIGIVIIKCFFKLINSKASEIMMGIISLFSFVWILFIINLYLNQEKSLDLNNWGDYLAGFFAPLLFIWVVFGIHLQKKEFKNAIDEYKKSVKFLEKQSINTDVQHQNIWFDRNVEMLLKYINDIENYGIDSNNKSTNNIEQLNKQIVNITISNFVLLIHKLPRIIKLDKYINDTLIYKIDSYNERTENNSDLFILSMNELKNGYDILFERNINACKNIFLKMIFFTYYAKIMGELDESNKSDPNFSEINKSLELIDKDKKNIIYEIINKNNIEIITDYIDFNFINSIENKISLEDRNKIIY